MSSEENTRARARKRAALVALVAANSFPAVGVLCLGWDAFLTVSVYFAETIVVGVYTWIRILTATGAPDPDAKQKVEGLGGRVFLALFFTVHYGMFVGAQTTFMMITLGPSSDLLEAARTGEAVMPWFREFGVAVLLLFASHGYSLVVYWFQGGDRHQVNPLFVMAKPYGRIFLQQFLVIFGIIIINALEANAGTVFILMLVAMKTAADAAMHRRSHREEAAGDT